MMVGWDWSLPYVYSKQKVDGIGTGAGLLISSSPPPVTHFLQ